MANERERALQEELRIQQEIDALNARRARWQQRDTAYSRRMLRNSEQELENQEDLLKVAQARTKEADSIDKKTSASLKSFARLSGDIKQNLGSLNASSNIYVNLQRQIIREEETRAGLSELDVEASEARAGFLRDISGDLLRQAQATAKAEQDAKGINEFQQRRNELQQNSLGLTQEQLDLAKDLVDQEELLYKKEQRLLEIKSQQEGIVSQLPSGIQSMIGFVQKLGAAIKAGFGPLFLVGAILVAAIKSFSDLDSAAKEFRETTGLTNSQMEGIKSDASEITAQFSSLGVEAKDVFNTVAALKSEFSDVADFSKETTAALTVLSANFGVSADNAAKVQGVLEQVSGLSSETAASVQLQVANMAKMAGVAPAKVMADIAESAEVASTLFKGDVNALAKSAIEARRLGTNLKSVAATAEKLLDFEGGIEDELTAATFVGGQFNLSRARALAFEGKIVEAQKETLSQIQKSGDFRKKDYFTQQQLAKAAGMSVEEINKQLDAQDKLNSLTSEQKKAAEDAINKGLDITNINADQLAQETAKFALQQEQQASLEKLQNAFTGIASTIGSVLTPLLEGLMPILSLLALPVQAIAEGFRLTGDFLKENIPLLTTLSVIAGIYYAKSIAGAVAKIWSSIVGFLGPFGIPVAIAASIGAISMAKNAMSSAGDMFSPADGKTQVSTKEGGLFELSPNDDLIAAPGAGKALNGESGGGGINLSALAAPIQAMVNEVKALRADLAAGKIAVYMDAQKVTNGVSKTVDQSTRNSYNLGTV